MTGTGTDEKCIIGIEARATDIVLSTGEQVDFDPYGSPENLLARIAAGEPYVRVANNQSHTLDSIDLYVAMIAGAINDRKLSDAFGLAVPGWWPPAAVSDVSAALTEQGITAELVNSAEAAVVGYRAAGRPLPDNTAVLSLRSQFTSVSVVRSCGGSPRALSSPQLVRSEGGWNLDAAVLQHLVRGLKTLGEDIDTSQPETICAAREALEQCRNLRESLSRNATGSVRLRLPGVSNKLLLVRSELDELAEPWLESMLSMVRTAIDQSSLGVDAVLLTGGLAAMPLVSQRISADLAVEVHVPENLRLVVAKGAALLSPRPTRRAAGWRGALRNLRPGLAGNSPGSNQARDSALYRAPAVLGQQ